jgi:hypothetical protein
MLVVLASSLDFLLQHGHILSFKSLANLVHTDLAYLGFYATPDEVSPLRRVFKSFDSFGKSVSDQVFPP